MGRGSRGHVAVPRGHAWMPAWRGGDTWRVYIYIYIFTIYIFIIMYIGSFDYQKTKY